MPSRKTAGRQQVQKNIDIWIGEALRFSCLSFLFPLGVAVDCGFLESPPNGGIVKKTGKTFGAIYVFECDEDKGYLMDGSKERRCQADATWSGVQPVCKCRFYTFHWYKPFILKRAWTKIVTSVGQTKIWVHLHQLQALSVPLYLNQSFLPRRQGQKQWNYYWKARLRRLVCMHSKEKKDSACHYGRGPRGFQFFGCLSRQMLRKFIC